jgi:hypothetical protein
MKVVTSQLRSIGPILFPLIALLLFSGCSMGRSIRTQEDLRENYLGAVRDAEIAEPGEICRNLVAIVELNEQLVWRGKLGKSSVLVITWTSWKGYDDKIGQLMNTTRDIWVTVVPELRSFYKRQPLDNERLTSRLEQLLGLPPNSGKSRFMELWVDPADLFRQSPDPEITDHEAELNFPKSERFLTVSSDHIRWFTALKDNSCTEQRYPWTRLGHTYD